MADPTVLLRACLVLLLGAVGGVACAGPPPRPIPVARPLPLVPAPVGPLGPGVQKIAFDEARAGALDAARTEGARTEGARTEGARTEGARMRAFPLPPLAGTSARDRSPAARAAAAFGGPAGGAQGPAAADSARIGAVQPSMARRTPSP